jgi:hypothetical protein
MSDQALNIPGALLFIAVFAVLGSGLFYLGMVRRSLTLKQFAVALVVMPCIAVGLQIGSEYFGSFRPDYRSTILYQTLSGAEFRTDETILPINQGDGTQQLELIPKVFGSHPPPAGPVTLEFTVRSPHGEVVLEKQQQTQAIPEKSRWQTIKAAFDPGEPGEYRLSVKAPAGVGSIDVWMHN